MAEIILLADNDGSSREMWGRSLSNAGYQVVLAVSLEEAHHYLQQGNISLAVIDWRLEDDDDKNDISGVLLAKDERYQHIAKVLLTAYTQKYKDVREALGSLADDLPPAVAIVDKAEGPHALIEVIRQTIEIWPRKRLSTAKVSRQIENDHRTARRQARLYFTTAFILSIFGGLIIFTGIALAWMDKLAVGIVGTAGGIIIEILGYLFYNRVDAANHRMDVYHKELLQTYWLEFILAVSGELPVEKRVQCIELAINTAIENWLAYSPEFLTSTASNKIPWETPKEETK